MNKIENIFCCWKRTFPFIPPGNHSSKIFYFSSERSRRFHPRPELKVTGTKNKFSSSSLTRAVSADDVKEIGEVKNISEISAVPRIRQFRLWKKQFPQGKRRRSCFRCGSFFLYPDKKRIKGGVACLQMFLQPVKAVSK